MADSQPDPGLVKETRELCDKLANEVMRPLVMQTEFVYIDAELLYDFRLGGLIAMTRDEEEYKYVYEHIEDYLTAPTLECAKFFPNLGVTDENIEAVLVDPNFKDQLAAIIPPTRFLFELRKLICVINTMNVSKESARPITLTINEGKHKLHPFVKRQLLKFIHTIDRNVVVLFTNFANWFEVPRDHLAKQDVICVYDLKEFLTEGTTSQKLLAETRLGAADILAINQTDVPVEDRNEAMLNLKIALELMCRKFTYIRKTLLRPEDITHGR